MSTPQQEKQKEHLLKVPLLKYFKFDHLPEASQKVSKPFCDLAYSICDLVPEGPERTVAIRKLLEAKDCAVRAALP